MKASPITHQETMFLNLFADSDLPALKIQLDRMEAKLDLLLQHSGLELPMDPMEVAVRDLLKANQPIEALKLVRSKTGMNLKSAKEWIANL